MRYHSRLTSSSFDGNRVKDLFRIYQSQIGPPILNAGDFACIESSRDTCTACCPCTCTSNYMKEGKTKVVKGVTGCKRYKVSYTAGLTIAKLTDPERLRELRFLHGIRPLTFYVYICEA